jgi:hypothetical protein
MRVVRACVLLALIPACARPVGQSKPADSAAPEIVIRPPPTNLPPPEPSAAAARKEAIRHDADVNRVQCEKAAGGDWTKWVQKTEGYRAALRTQLADLQRREREEIPSPGPKFLALAGRDDFPLFEIGARENLHYLTDPASYDDFRARKPVVVASRWLRRWGVDLIFVPVPKMTEVYIDHFIDPAPPDGIIAPYTRRALLEMLDAGVEVVDVFALFRPRRAPDPSYLYHTADTHWAPRGMQIAAAELARRIERYDFAKVARRAPPVFKEATEPYYGDRGTGYMLLNEEQRQRLADARTQTWNRVTTPDGGVLLDDAKSPVFLVGNSYLTKFRELLIRELNLGLRTNQVHGSTTEPIRDFLVAPEFLSGVRVVIWVTTEEHMAHFKPLPAPFQAALEDPE